ncbi:transcription factor IIIA [Sergentomyia squamirostris]
MEMERSPWSESSDTEVEQAVKPAKINYKCSWGNCEQGFNRENAFDRHLFTHTGIKTHKCSIGGCEKSYIIVDHLRRHVKITHETLSAEQIPCQEASCSMVFTTRSNMIKHLRRKHENPRKFSCADCSEVFRRKDQLRRHRVKHTGQFPHVCETCGKGFLNLKSFRSHGVVHRRLKCQQCEREVSNWTELVAHRRTEHPNLFECSICKREFRSKRSLRGHEVIHKPREEQPKFTCEACSKDFTRKSNLLAHILLVHEKRKHPCSQCHASLSTKNKLELHIAKIHSANPREPRKRPQRPRNRRKDAGKSRISAASRLAGISAPPEIEQILLRDEGRCLEINYTTVYKSGSATDTESERSFPLSGVKVTFKGVI